MSGALLGRNGAAAPPVRMVHLGLGAFHRSHQAWYTGRADRDGEWGIAAFTGRSPDAADALARQDGLYTLIERSGSSDSFEVVTSIAAAVDGGRTDALRASLAAERTALVTITATEAAYCLLPDGGLDMSAPAIIADLAELAMVTRGGALDDADPRSLAGRLVLGLEQRRRDSGAAIAVVSCDNLLANGERTARMVGDLAAAVLPALAEWIRGSVSFVGTSVDRITPRTTAEDIAAVEAMTAWSDAVPVVAEPFSDWVLSGAFPLGRPEWERAGATVVDAIAPYEQRKLWLLNGAHSLLAYAGIARGHRTVDQAMADPVCAEWVDELWDEAQRHLPEGLGIAGYRAALLERFANPRIAHDLRQIALDGRNKLRMRVLPVYEAERAAGRSGAACLRAVSAWLDYEADSPSARRALLEEWSPALAADPHAVDVIGAFAGGLGVAHA